ncbi:D-2-hydroxyacid dehydrogenase [Candidatus Bathyarchaeota archaeon]|nr:MAG: D-2-hydroxyacid dehydrogenase [Candidatus Bathyarchaeota archaeon]
MTIRVAVSGIPRGYQYPRSDLNWLHEKHIAQIKAVSPEIELIEVPPDKVPDEADFEVVLVEGGNRTHYHGELDWLDYQKFFRSGLMWVQLCSTGFSDNITTEVLDGSVTLTNAPGIHTYPIAESVITAMLDHAKMLKQRRVDQREHHWNQLKCDELYKRTVLIIGLGNIGKRTARLCKAFDMRVIGMKRSAEPVENVDFVFPGSELRERLAEADYVVVAAPLTPETKYMLGKEEFGAMKRTAYYINIGRGAVAWEPALIRALEENWIAGAYLDALEVEPIPVDHPFWGMKNVLLIPHDSHSSPYIGDRIVDIFCENLDRYVKGVQLKNICDPSKGY